MAKGIESHMAQSHMVNGCCFDSASCENICNWLTQQCTQGVGKRRSEIACMLTAFYTGSYRAGIWAYLVRLKGIDFWLPVSGGQERSKANQSAQFWQARPERETEKQWRTSERKVVITYQINILLDSHISKF